MAKSKQPAKSTKPAPAKAEPEEIFEGPVTIRSTAAGPVRMIGMRRTRADGVFEFYGMEAGYRLSGSTVGQQVTRYLTRQADNPDIQTFAQFQAYAAPLLPAGAKEWFEHQVWVRP